MQILQTQEISKAYRGRKVVDDVSISVEQGEVVGLLGPNGAGKTTSFYMIVGLISPDSGSVMLNDDEITNLPMYLRARKGISYLPQEPSVFRRLSVEENLLAILETLSMNGRGRRDRMNQLVEQLGLEKVRHNKGYALSGGERRRVEIARSLAINPNFLCWTSRFPASIRFKCWNCSESFLTCGVPASAFWLPTTTCGRHWPSPTAPTSSTTGKSSARTPRKLLAAIRK